MTKTYESRSCDIPTYLEGCADVDTAVLVRLLLDGHPAQGHLFDRASHPYPPASTLQR
jgi:hypothetical protein